MLRNVISAVFIVLVMVSGAHSATIEGFVGDGKTSISYDSATGAFGVQPDGQPVGQYQILSNSGIFNADALKPPGGLGSDVNSVTEKSWVASPAAGLSADFNLGPIALAGLTKSFLLGDLTLTGSGGLATPNRAFDLVHFTTSSVGIVVVDAWLSGGLPGVHFAHQFMVSAGQPPITWSNLAPIIGSPTPNFVPTLTTAGQFNWNTAGSPLGVYSWNVTATNAAISDTGRLVVTLFDTPEPSAITLIGLAAPFMFGSFRRQRQWRHEAAYAMDIVRSVHAWIPVDPSR